MLNAGYDFRRNNAGLLVNPEQASAGWKNLGKGLQVAAGIMSWKDAKDRADRMNKAQEDYYDALTSYLNNKDVDVKSQQDAIEDEELYSQLEDLPEDENNNEAEAAYEASNASQTGGSDADYAYRMALARRNQYADILDSILKKYGYGGK
jgi:hypothetical protein